MTLQIKWLFIHLNYFRAVSLVVLNKLQSLMIHFKLKEQIESILMIDNGRSDKMMIAI